MSKLLVPAVLAFVVITTGLFSKQIGARAAAREIARIDEAAKRVALHVMHAEGVSRQKGDTAPLVPGDVLRGGDLVELGADAKLRMVTPTGDRIRLSGPGRMVIGQLDEPRVLPLSFIGTSIDFAGAAGGTLALDTGHGTVSCTAGAFLVTSAEGHRHVEARVGPVILQRAAEKHEVRVGAPEDF